MCIVIQRILSAVALVALAGYAPAAFGGYGGGVTAIEKAQLPKFCWKQMEVPNAIGPQFEIPRSCGPGMNHYCPGMVDLIRARGASDKRQRLSFLGRAESNINYTLEWMKGWPDCPIRGHVEAAKAEVESIRRIYGGAGSKAPATSK